MISRGAAVHQPLVNYGLLKTPLPKAHVREALEGGGIGN